MGINRTVPGKKAGDEDECIQDRIDETEANEEFEEITEVLSESSISSVDSTNIHALEDVFLDSFPSYSETFHHEPKKSKLKSRLPSPSPHLTNIGQRRARRIANNLHLIEIGGGDFDVDSEEPRNSIFSRILKNEPEYQIWEKFLSSSEEEQLSLIHRSKSPQLEHRTKKTDIVSGKEAFQLLTPSQRFVVKKNRTLGFLTKADEEMLCFFLDTPFGTYRPRCFSSFERLIIHAIANYYQLQSYSFNDSESNERTTHVSNTKGSFRVPTLTLSNYLSLISTNDEGYHFIRSI